MEAILLVVHILLAIFLISLVLLQRGKGAEVGAAFGRGASATVFGARGSASFLTKLTAIAAILFFGTSLSLAYIASHRQESESSIFNNISEQDSVVPQASSDDRQEEAKAELSSEDVPPVEEASPADVPPIEE